MGKNSGNRNGTFEHNLFKYEIFDFALTDSVTWATYLLLKLHIIEVLN